MTLNHNEVVTIVDEATTVEEVATVISTLAELEYVNSKDIYFRKSCRGTQATKVTLSIIAANKLLQRGKFRISRVNYRVRLRTDKCYG